MKINNPFCTLTRFEWSLWITSLTVVTLSFLIGGDFQFLTLTASLIGVTALIFVAKGAVLGQILTVLFSLIYSIISLRFHYYGEMITYMGMTAPIAVMSVISWMKHPYEKGKSEVKIAKLKRYQIIMMLFLSTIVTAVFYFVLKYFNTANLLISTISITTSFLASYLMLFRSPTYAIAYAANDMVLIILWVLAAIESLSYLPMVICFVMFFCNDIYGFYNWQRMRIKQKAQFHKKK